jgi:hypothetical protein
MQRHRAEVAATVKRFEESLDNTDISVGDRKQIQLEISANKVVFENLTTEEQQRQTEQMEAGGATADRASKTEHTRRKGGSARKSVGQRFALSQFTARGAWS